MARTDFVLKRNVSVRKLQLDPGNPRIRSARDQSECIERILRKEAQMQALMRSIAEDGLTTMPIIAKASLDGTLTVMDGNRRVTALKLLNDPKVCPVPHLVSKIKTLREKHLSGIPQKIDVLVSSDDDAIAREVLARHAGAAGGAGQLNWSAYLRTVFEINHGHPAQYMRPGLYAMWAEEQGVDVDDEFPITSLERFFSRENLLLLGFKLKKDKIEPTTAAPIIKKLAARLISDFSSGKVKVDDVRKPDMATGYLNKIREELGITSGGTNSRDFTEPSSENAAPLPTPTPEPGGDSHLPRVAQGEQQNPGGNDEPRPPTGTNGSQEGATTGRGRTPLQHPSERDKLFVGRTPNINIPPTEVKAAAIVAELRGMKLKGPGGTPIAATFLLRGLLEITAAYYRDKHNLPDRRSLAKNIKEVASHLQSRDLLTDNQVDAIKRAADDTEGALSIELLQRLLHRSTHIASAHRAVALWDEVGCLVREAWNN